MPSCDVLSSLVPVSPEALARVRTDFEVRLREPYNHHVACMMMGAGNEAYFPVGVASRRVARVKGCLVPAPRAYASSHG